MKSHRLLSAVGLVLCAALSGQAKEIEPMEFLQALQAAGYHEIAVDYLLTLQQNKDLPPELADVFDLEMSKCQRGAANRAYDAKEAAARMEEAQKSLEKFLKEKKDHPQAAQALLSGGGFSVDIALRKIRDAKAVKDKDKDEAAKLYSDARAKLVEARKRFSDAYTELQKKLASLPPPPKPQPGKKVTPSKEARATAAQRAGYETSMLDAVFQIALVDYYTALTYTDEKDPGRAAALKSAATGFDSIWQARRFITSPSGDAVDPVGLQAHMWHGKVTDDLGDWETALDIYEEVLTSESENPRQIDKVLDPLFAQVHYFRYALLRKHRLEDFMAEVPKYLQLYSAKSRHDGYQGIALEWAEVLAAQVEKLSGAEKTKAQGDLMKILNAMARTPSSHQNEAFELRNRLTGSTGENLDEAKTFSDAIAIGDRLNAKKKWADAAQAYAKALELGKGKDAAAAGKVRDVLAAMRLRHAAELAEKGNFAECQKFCRLVIDSLGESPSEDAKKNAQGAGQLMVDAQLQIWAALPQKDEAEKKAKEAALAEMLKLVAEVNSKFPGTPAADTVNLASGKASLQMGKFDEALKVFEAVTDRSASFHIARYLAARTYWLRKIQKQGGGAKDADLTADRDQAHKLSVEAVGLFRKRAETGKPLDKDHFEAELLLGEIELEKGDAAAAAKIFQPLVDQIKAQKPERIDDPVMLRAFFGAEQAYLQVKDTEKATDVGLLLAELGPDHPQINGLLLSFALALDKETKNAEAALTKATSANDQKARQEALAYRDRMIESLGKVMKRLAQKKQLSTSQKIYIADKCSMAGLDEDATVLYEAVLALAEEGDAVAQKYATFCRTKRIGLLRKQGKFDQAAAEVDKLIDANPKALEPLVEKGRVLQAWAEQDPSMFDKAVAHWNFIRNKLEGLKKKPREYFEVIYYAADCVRLQAEKAAASGDKKTAVTKATDGAKWLTSAMVLNSKLSESKEPDVEMIAKYDALLKTLKGIIAQNK